MNIIERIDRLRIKKGWSLSYFATQIGISRNAVQAWFHKENVLPTRQTIEIICEVFGITLTEFYSEIDTNKLSAKEILMLEYFRKIPEENSEQVLAIVKSFVE